jgi:hypothetical protein
MVETHFAAAVLQGLPADQRTLDDETAFMPPMSAPPPPYLALRAAAHSADASPGAEHVARGVRARAPGLPARAPS